jgi:NitT/TauT family transport system ATP-binding protein
LSAFNEGAEMTLKMPMLEIRELSKTYPNLEGADDKYRVFSDITFDVPEHQFVCLLGSSGCGKTTLLRILAGLVEATDGEVRVDRQVVRGPGQDRSIVFQNYGLLPWRTVWGNVEFGLEIRGMSAAERRPICQKYIDIVGLTGFEKRYPHQISGGMQQRVALARAFSKSPKVLLMDEPFAAVDMQTREKLQDELLLIWTQIRTTVVFVTHSVDEAIFLADRVIVMAARPGRVVADITTDLPRPRRFEEVKTSAQFNKLQREVRAAIAVSGDEG